MRQSTIAVTLVTGFLGSGKTTLINQLLRDPALKNTAVIVNEFGEVGIDHYLVETADEGIIEMSDGCLCCTIRGDLADTLASLVDRLQTGRLETLNQVVIETTGLADPVPILSLLLYHPIIKQAFHLARVVTTFDCVNGLVTLQNHSEAQKQLIAADLVVLTKSDLCEDRDFQEKFNSILALYNPGVTVIDKVRDGLTPAQFLTTQMVEFQNKPQQLKKWLAGYEADTHHHHHDVNRHDSHISAFNLTHDQPINAHALHSFLDLLHALHGEQLLRMKAIVHMETHPEQPLILHAVQKLLHEPVKLDHWGDMPRQTRMVLIMRDGDQQAIMRLFAAITNQAAIDTPDRDAVLDNPLAIAGLKF